MLDLLVYVVAVAACWAYLQWFKVYRWRVSVGSTMLAPVETAGWHRPVLPESLTVSAGKAGSWTFPITVEPLNG